MVESSKPELVRSASGRAIETFKDISPRNKAKVTEEMIEAQRQKAKEEEEKQEEERKHAAFRDGVFERHRSSSRSASTSSARAKRAQCEMRETREGFETMIDGYNRAVTSFNETAAMVADREE